MSKTRIIHERQGDYEEFIPMFYNGEDWEVITDHRGGSGVYTLDHATTLIDLCISIGYKQPYPLVRGVIIYPEEKA